MLVRVLVGQEGVRRYRTAPRTSHPRLACALRLQRDANWHRSSISICLDTSTKRPRTAYTVQYMLLRALGTEH